MRWKTVGNSKLQCNLNNQLNEKKRQRQQQQQKRKNKYIYNIHIDNVNEKNDEILI